MFANAELGILNIFSSFLQVVDEEKQEEELRWQEIKKTLSYSHSYFSPASSIWDIVSPWMRWDSNGYPINEISLCSTCTLMDLKIITKKDQRFALIFENKLGLDAGLSRINERIDIKKRILEVENRILKQVTLKTLPMTGSLFTIENSPVWFALDASDENFLNRNVLDLEEAGSYCSNDLIRVIKTRILSIENKNPHLLETTDNLLADDKGKSEETPSYVEDHFPGMRCQIWTDESPITTIRDLHRLTGEELNDIAGNLSYMACRLISEQQLLSLDFSRFSDFQLEAIAAGNGEKEEKFKRVALFSPENMRVFFEKTSGSYFGFFPDWVFETLPLSTLTKSEIAKLFHKSDDHAEKHFQLVPPQEVRNGLHLLSDKQLRLLSPPQIASLDYSKVSKEQLDCIFPHEEKIHYIPPNAINDVLRVATSFVGALTSNQLSQVDPNLLQKEEINILFPPITPENLYPGYSYQIVPQINGIVLHKFEKNSSSRSYKAESLSMIISERKFRCKLSTAGFSHDQLKALFPKISPDVQEFLLRENLIFCSLED